MKKFFKKCIDYVFNRRKYNRDKIVAAFIEGHGTFSSYYADAGDVYEKFHQMFVLTEEELDQIFSSVVLMGCWFYHDRECGFTPGNLMYFISPPMRMLLQKQPNVSPAHIDMLLGRKTFDIATMVFDGYPNLTSEQIKYGLNHEHVVVNELAVNHPNCTEAQRVSYYLRCGI